MHCRRYRRPGRTAARAAPPELLIEHGTGRLPARVHTGQCWDTRTRCKPATADQARRALTEGVCARPRPPTRHRPRSAGTNQWHRGGISPALRVVVYPPDAEGGRRVRCDGEILGRAVGPADPLEFMRRAGLNPDTVRLDDPLLIGWRGGGPTVWTPDSGGA
ncbi:DUF6233 domain-containing protein [Streptomyces lavendulae]|uniref:DUF6233 domain-containing protein n=1 Tax=Streptomyces lavendulae TaxID=1914 RepID=UPI0036821600